jgi:cation transporter-like permease
MSNKLVTGSVLAVIGLITIKVLGFLFFATLGFFGLMFKIIPIILIAWVIWRVVKYIGRPSTAES